MTLDVWHLVTALLGLLFGVGLAPLVWAYVGPTGYISGDGEEGDDGGE